MKARRPHEYIEGFADLVVPQDPLAFRQRLLATVVATLSARRVALFVVDSDRLRIVASNAVDQASLDRAREMWVRGRAALAAGQPLFGAAPGAGVVIVPVQEPEGLLYAESARALCAQDQPELERLGRLAAIALRDNDAVGGLSKQDAAGYLRNTTEDDVLRDKLVLALQEHEWNIARVARLLGVTRRTIYLRLKRWSIPRRKVSKAARREA